MTSEQNVPEVQSPQGSSMSAGQQDGDEQFSGANVPHGMGQSKSSRRRRRKRKTKGPDSPQDAAQAGTSGEQSADQPIGSIQAASVQTSQPQSFQANSGQQQNGANGSAPAKRWKKKFRDRDRQRSPENPGNVASSGSSNGGGFRDSNSHQPGNNGFKRKSGGGGGGRQQQRGPRSFVGPMDHSYRVANGNFADTPPSTIETHGNFQGRGGGGGRGYQSDSQPIDYSQGKTIPIPEDAPTKIFFFIEDLFFIAKIQETARKLGVKIAFIKNDKESIATLTGLEEEERPGLIVFDLNNANAKPLTLIPKLKTKLKRSTSIVGFLSHLQGDLKAKAVEAGCDTVMPRAAFSQNLPNLLRRYGLVEEDEPNFNQ
ncbi:MULTISPECIES: response regulator [Acidobacteriaceae]|uniref:response regulator n=1 Tax=Acidobacteriaceae TaxID=204434 RepID=UPI00131D077B|nr:MULTISPECIES: response regulator [Acidobacteriaceae]MDW5264746.1 response regulator [Edaphobacter sp.]